MLFRSTDYDQDCRAYKNFEDKIIQLSQVSKVVFTLESELHHYHWGLWYRCHRDNVYWVVPGLVNDQPEMNDRLIFWGDWFKTTANLYKQLPEVQARFTPFNLKEKYFDNQDQSTYWQGRQDGLDEALTLLQNVRHESL